jgi:hypothetical protein
MKRTVILLIFVLVISSFAINACSLLERRDSPGAQETQLALVIAATANVIRLETQSALLTDQAQEPAAPAATDTPEATEPPPATATPWPTRTPPRRARRARPIR